MNAAADRWAASTARRMTLPRCCADSTSGRSRPSGAANARTATCTADRASTSRSVVRVSQASSSAPALRCGTPLRSDRPCCLAFREASAASWAMAHKVRWLGSRPYRWRYSSAMRRTSGVICARRLEKASMTSWDTPPTSKPLPSARGTST